MSTVILMNAVFYLVGGVLFGGVGWIANRLARRVGSPGIRRTIAAVTSLLPVLVPLALWTASAFEFGLATFRDPKLLLFLMTFAPLVLPTALGSLWGARGLWGKSRRVLATP